MDVWSPNLAKLSFARTKRLTTAATLRKRYTLDIIAQQPPDAARETLTQHLLLQIEGAICQMRSHQESDELNHGMCKPGGCTHWFISRGSAQALLAPGESAPWYSQVPGIQSPAVVASTVQSSQNLLVILPQKLLDFECHSANPNNQLAKKSQGQWCGPVGCLDMGAGGFAVVHQWTPEGGGVACLLERARVGS